jgi:hypothetical protein
VDFRDFGHGKAPDTKAMEAASLRWWDEKGRACADGITHALMLIDRAQGPRTTQLMASARLYGNTPLLGIASAASARYAGVQNALKERLNYNAVQSVIDTAIARLTRDKPTPYHLTSGGDYHVQRKAKKLNELRDGIFYECQTYRKGEMCARDGAIWGDGLLKVFEKNGRVCHERVPGSQIYIDEMEAIDGCPRSLHQVMDVDRDVLHDWFDCARATRQAIEDANRAPQTGNASTADTVTLRESWHLPSGPKAKDGKHVISIAGETLLEEKWQHDFFPFARFPWCPKAYGFWSQGLAEQLQPMQLELNKLLHALQISYQRACLMLWVIENGSKVVKAHIDNEIGRLITYTGTPPQVQTPPIAPPEIYQQIETLIRRMREQAGLSEMATQGQKPAGVDSGKALRTLDDMESVRMTQISHAYEQFYLDVDKLSIACAHDIAEEEGDYEVRVPGKRSMRTRKWSEIDLEQDDYSIHVYPTSSLPDDPAGRLQTITEYVQAGMIPQEIGMEMLEFPDLKKFETLQNAMEDRLHEVLDDMVDEGEYAPPEPDWNLQRADALALQYKVLGESQGLEPERIEMLRRFRIQIGMMQEMAQMAAMPAANGPPGAPPQAAPMPPPTSQLLPNAPGAAA